MPIQVDLSRLDEGEGLENTFVRWKARWHKSCYDLFNSMKLKRAQKRQGLETEQPVVESLHIQLHLHLSTIAVHAFFVKSILHVITLFTMSQHLAYMLESGSVRWYYRMKSFWRS